MATQVRQGPGLAAVGESDGPRTGGPSPTRESPPLEKASALTARETEVLALVAEGYSNKAIAFRLGISERTVKSHLTYVMAKLGTSDRTHSVVTAVRLGWLDL
ncbi:MAG: response regulator transcription factor [Chloroflexi bacterium]|nr:response regulator transcription factor [Chloroflexota bacterium]